MTWGSGIYLWGEMREQSAGAPQGAYYDYFSQSALYALAWAEMGNGDVDDIGIVSCRKDGEFEGACE